MNEVTLYTWYPVDEQEDVAAAICDDMRGRLCNQGGFRTSLCGNRLTLRWSTNGNMHEVHMIIDSVRSPLIPDEHDPCPDEHDPCWDDK
jgi:hypothetical protein